MQSKSMFETLENRTLLAANPASATLIGETGGVVAAARAAVTAAPEISITQRTMYFNAVQGQTNTQILRITNNGSANLDLVAGSVTLAGSARKNFTVNFPAGGFSIKPNRRLDLEITFNSPTGEAPEVKVARLAIVTNDPSMPSVTVGLRALPTTGIGGSDEPSLARVLETFGLPTNVGDATPGEYQLGTPTAGNDEVTIQKLVKAGPGAVSIRPLAVFGTDNGPAVRIGTYTPGQAESIEQLWYVPREDAQSVNPKAYGQTLIDPGSAEFGLVGEFPGFANPDGARRNVYSEDGLNSVWEPSTTNLRKMRFYPFVDSNGNAAPNTYVVAVEEYTKAYDFQDVIFIISNVKPVETAAPIISVQAINQAPGSQNVVFNRVEIPEPLAPNITRLRNVIRIRNTGTSDLVVTISTTGNFLIDKNGGTNVAITAGGFRDVTVRFSAVSGSVHRGTLNITSNDTTRPTVSVPLVGYWQQYSEFIPTNKKTLEPQLKTIINDLFGFTTKLTNPGQSLSTLAKVEATGDEVLSPYWMQADDGAPVRVTMLATFKFQYDINGTTGATFPSNETVGWHLKGQNKANQIKTIVTSARGDSQSVLPRKNNPVSQVASSSFNPGDVPFGFVVERTEYSDPTLNPDKLGRTGYGHYIRFWPAYDAQGIVLPNTYIMVHDYNREFTNYDYQDGVFLVENIVPENAIKAPLTVFTEETSRGARISFTSPATGPRINGFRVYRSTDPRGTYSLLTDTPLARRPVTTFIDDSVTADQTFYYKVVSVGANGLESQGVVVKI